MPGPAARPEGAAALPSRPALRPSAVVGAPGGAAFIQLGLEVVAVGLGLAGRGDVRDLFVLGAVDLRNRHECRVPH